MGAFNDKVYEVVRQIPAGYVSTYGDIARAIGQPRKALFVGYAMKSTTDPDAVPCHRVVFKDGHFWGEDEDGNPTPQRIMLEGSRRPRGLSLDARAYGCGGAPPRHRLGS